MPTPIQDRTFKSERHFYQCYVIGSSLIEIGGRTEKDKMLLPLNNGEWQAHEAGHRLVCQPTYDPASRYFAIVTNPYLYNVARVRLLEDERSSEGFGKVRGVGENEVLGYIGHPLMQRLWADDLIWVNDLTRDGKTRADGFRFAVVMKIDHQLTTLIRRFNQKTHTWAKTSTLLHSKKWMRLGNLNVPADRAYFEQLLKAEIDTPALIERPQAPIPALPPDDPRAFTRVGAALLVSTAGGPPVTISRLEYSTKYPQSFLRQLNSIQSGAAYCKGWQALLTYYGPTDPDIPGSDLGEVSLCFHDGQPCAPGEMEQSLLT
jgi:hypothetical protein